MLSRRGDSADRDAPPQPTLVAWSLSSLMSLWYGPGLGSEPETKTLTPGPDTVLSSSTTLSVSPVVIGCRNLNPPASTYGQG